MFFYVFFLLHFRLMVGREVDGPLWAVLNCSRSLCGQSWASLATSVGGLGRLSGPLWAVLGRSWGLCGRSWAALGAYVGGLGSLSGPMWAVLAALGAYVGGLGKGSGRKVGQTRAGRPFWGGIRPESGPNPSGKAVLGRQWFFDVFGARNPVRIFSVDI